MSELLILLGVVFVSFTFGYGVCAIMSSGRCQDCRLKELKELEDDSD